MGVTSTARRQIERLLPFNGNSFFPNLRTLKFTQDSALPHIMGPNVTELTWLFESGSPESNSSLRDVAVHIVERMPKLESISLEGCSAVVEHEDVLMRLCQSLPALKHIGLPRYALSPTMLRGLSAISTLSRITVNRQDEGFQESTLGRRSRVMRWAGNAPFFSSPLFVNLHELSFALPTLSSAIRFFLEDGFSMSGLAGLEIFIAFPRESTADKVEEFLHVLFQQCATLEELRLSMYVESAFPSDLFGLESLMLSTIMPVARFSQLRSISLDHALPLSLRDEDVRVLVAELPLVEVLRLNPHPLFLSPPSLTVASVFTVARCCRFIRILGLYFDPRIFLPIPSDAVFPETFERLDVGTSPFPTPATAESLWLIAEVIANLVPERAVVHSGFVDPAFDSIEFSPASVIGGFVNARDGLLQGYHEGWQTVDCMARSFRAWMVCPRE